MEQLADYAVIRSLKRFRDRYFPDRSKLVKNETKPNLAPEPPEPGFLDILPVSHVWAHIFGFVNSNIYEL